MAQREEVLNTLLADILQELKLIDGFAEAASHTSSGKKIPDVTIYPIAGSKRHIRLEAKLGTGAASKKAAVEQATKHLSPNHMGQTFGCIALCYPEYFSEVMETVERRRLFTEIDELLFAGISSCDADETSVIWQAGSVHKLADLIRQMESGDMGLIDGLNAQIEKIAEMFPNDEGLSVEMADALKLSGKTGRRPFRIAALIMLNAAMLQIRLRQTRKARAGAKIPDISRITKKSNPHQELAQQWDEIIEIDYRPVFYPALAALETIPPESDGVAIAREVVSAAQYYAPIMGNIRLDHAGPLYHRLLITAPNDGSFYTTTPAAVILARLAVPDNWTDWKHVDVRTIRVIDPACGTGTLLMATLQIIKERIIAARDDLSKRDLSEIHRSLVEDVMHGIDINRHAVHLAACMLTFAAPDADYRRMNIDRYPHGPYKGSTQAGSLDLLVAEEGAGKFHFHDDLNLEYEALEQENESDLPPQASMDNMSHTFDLAIMNPPYTRNSLRNHQHDEEIQKKIDHREKKIQEAVLARDRDAGRAINLATVQTFFFPLADKLLKKDARTLATVIPSTVATGAAALQQRRFLAKRFHVETVITSHDPDNKYFSGNTNINESLFIARKNKGKQSPTKFISLRRNPNNVMEALAFVDSFERDNMDEWGTSVEWPLERIVEGDWTPAVFYNTKLAFWARDIVENTHLTPIGEMANLRPDGRLIRQKFQLAKGRPDFTALWFHKGKKRNTIVVRPDKIKYKNEQDRSKALTHDLQQQQSHLLLANRFRVNTAHVMASWVEQKSLGNAWIPVTPFSSSKDTLKAWCMWGNSTPHFLSMLSKRQKDFGYASFALEGLRELPFPNPDKADITPLVKIFAQCSTAELSPLHLLEHDSIRAKIDDAVAKVVKIKPETIREMRKLIAMEPSVSGERL